LQTHGEILPVIIESTIIDSMDVDILHHASMDVNMYLVTDLPVRCCSPLAAGVLDDQQAADLAEALKALADPIRLRLVSIIANAPTGEVCTCDLPEAVGRSQPTVSHHLSLLVNAGLVEREQRGKWAWFRLRDERLAELGRAISPTDPR
jgi:ArsR family transcriptional regulator